MAERLSPTEVLSGTEAAALTAHRTGDGSDHSIVGDNNVVSVHAALALATLNNEVSAALSGSATKKFIPEAAEVIVTAITNTPNGDAQITIGTSSGGTQICAATPLTGLAAVGAVYRIALTGNFADQGERDEGHCGGL